MFVCLCVFEACRTCGEGGGWRVVGGLGDYFFLGGGKGDATKRFLPSLVAWCGDLYMCSSSVCKVWLKTLMTKLPVPYRYRLM